ncbi:hypothetical protein OJF2_10440 [Aquisphaera giovannonii]|uniref:DUF4259 domain-containing protein n=1 Tax=Aquisphaera giovannonii TaxID=406548 RepID=A0A5B9VX86_9BACT|nr:hypothetical protein [Aquisphaera giovannonii]QEH32567.1 hypothetical protein OJF2_10440 [Aquisphaera giovannonii]
MGHWGVRSYENDDADDALDAGFEEACGEEYEALMDDRNPLPFDQVQGKLASGKTLEAAVRALEEMVGGPFDAEPGRWDPEARLAMAGVVVRHAEFGVPIPPPLRDRAIACLEGEEIEWDEATKRRLRREKEIALLRRAAGGPGSS